MSEYTTIWEDFDLPSKGLIYDKPINPRISLRSMTTAEEMKRLSPTETPYKVMCDIIEDCMKEKPEMHVSDMAISDYQYLLHKLRIVTYGNNYNMIITCPQCGESKEVEIDLDSLEITEWSNELDNLRLITLPVTNSMIELKFQSPRDLDIVAYRAKELQKKLKTGIDYSMMFTVMSLINKVDGRPLTDSELQEFVKNLPIRDVHFILSKSADLAKKLGINAQISVKCPICGFEFDAPFRITSEFFGPTED